MQGFTSRMILPVLQEKLWHGTVAPGEWVDPPPEVHPYVAMAVVQGQEQSTQAVDNLLSCMLVQKLGMDESCTAGITDILEHLVPQLLVNTAMRFKTVYFNMPEPMSQLLLQLQQGDIFAREQLKKLPSLPVASKAECLPWG